ncbi:MAG: PH domain-containing protein [Candidatus Zixiibacteriota bacterium]|nr:MAG: PH domain-containing protein [candidate division Zixibacteria bacterium]
MGYVESNLMSGEKIIRISKLHWAIFIWPIIWVILGILFIAVPILGGFFILIGVVTLLLAFIDYSTSEFGVTDKRVIAKLGFIRRTSLEILHTKVESIQVDQSIMGRLLGFGTIIVRGTGGSKDPFRKIPDPMEFRKIVQEQVANTQSS